MRRLEQGERITVHGLDEKALQSKSSTSSPAIAFDRTHEGHTSVDSDSYKYKDQYKDATRYSSRKLSESKWSRLNSDTATSLSSGDANSSIAPSEAADGKTEAQKSAPCIYPR